MCGTTFANVGNTIRHVVNIHKISRDVAHSLWTPPSPDPDEISVFEEYNDDEDVIFAVDCSTHEEIPITTLVIE